MKKRITAVALVLALVLQLFCGVGVLATEGTSGAAITVGNVTAGIGATEIKVPVAITGNPGIAGLRLSVSWPAGLTLTSTENGSVLGSAYFAEGEASGASRTLVWIGADNDTSNGTLATLTFTAASAGNYTVTVSAADGDVLDKNQAQVPVTCESGTVTAEEPEPAGPVIKAGGGAVEAGKTVSVPITVTGNPGIAGMRLSVSWPVGLTLTNAAKGEALDSLYFASSNPSSTGCKLVWIGADNDTTAGTLATLTFTASDSAEPKDYAISITAAVGDILDAAKSTVTMEFQSGTVTVTAPAVDKSTLASLISTMSRITDTGYSAESWTAFQTALDNAITINNNANATQAEIDGAIAALNAAKGGLVKVSVSLSIEPWVHQEAGQSYLCVSASIVGIANGTTMQVFAKQGDGTEIPGASADLTVGENPISGNQYKLLLPLNVGAAGSYSVGYKCGTLSWSTTQTIYPSAQEYLTSAVDRNISCYYNKLFWKNNEYRGLGRESSQGTGMDWEAYILGALGYQNNGKLLTAANGRTYLDVNVTRFGEKSKEQIYEDNTDEGGLAKNLSRELLGIAALGGNPRDVGGTNVLSLTVPLAYVGCDSSNGISVDSAGGLYVESYKDILSTSYYLLAMEVCGATAEEGYTEEVRQAGIQAIYNYQRGISAGGRLPGDYYSMSMFPMPFLMNVSGMEDKAQEIVEKYRADCSAGIQSGQGLTNDYTNAMAVSGLAACGVELKSLANDPLYKTPDGLSFLVKTAGKAQGNTGYGNRMLNYQIMQGNVDLLLGETCFQKAYERVHNQRWASLDDPSKERPIPGVTVDPDPGEEEPGETVTVSFTLLGDEDHSWDHNYIPSLTEAHTLKEGGLITWIPETSYTVTTASGKAKVSDLLAEVEKQSSGLTFSGLENGYVSAVTWNGQTIGEFTNGNLSGWMYTLNGGHPENGVNDQTLSTGDKVVFHYTDYFEIEEGGMGGTSGLDAKIADAGRLNASDYTAGSWAALQTALTAAKAVSAKADATRDEVSNALKALQAAIDGLQRAVVEPYDQALRETLAYIRSSVTEPGFGSTNGEWSVLALARGDADVGVNYFDNYYSRIVSAVQGIGSAKLHEYKSTDNSRLILALTAIGRDPANVGGYNLLEPLADFNWTVDQGVNGAVFALIALDSRNYESANRQKLVDYIVGSQLSDGSFPVTPGGSTDLDMTGMALQALAKYKDQTAVKDAIDKALTYLSRVQNSNGGFGTSSEAAAQAIVALTALGIDPMTDTRFAKAGGNPVSALLNFGVTGGGFKHTMDQSAANAMATDQAAYALVAYNRFKTGKAALYDMTDITVEVLANGEFTVAYNGASPNGVTITLTENEGYNLPETVTVRMDGADVESDKFSYDKATGVVTFAASVNVGHKIVVTGSGICNHENLQAVQAVSASCTAEGVDAYWKCGTCNKLFSDANCTQEIARPAAVAKTAHTLTGTAAVAATCENAGTAAYWTCSVCRKMFSDESGKNIISAVVAIPALGHTLTKTDAVAATCKTTGTAAYWTCTNTGCGKKFSDEFGQTEIQTTDAIPTTGHTDADRNGYCDVCNTALRDFRSVTLNPGVAGAENVGKAQNYRVMDQTSFTLPAASDLGWNPRGYRFAGWKNSSVSSAGTSIPITVDTTFTAQWALVSVNYTVNSETIQVVPGTKVYAPAYPTTGPGVGLRYAGWTDGAKTYNPGDPITVNADTTLVPVTVMVPKYYVTVKNGNAVVAAATEMYSGETYTVPNALPTTPLGDKFTYWKDEAGKAWFPGDEIVIGNADIVLDAVWVAPEIKTVTFKLSENGTAATVKFHDGTITLPKYDSSLKTNLAAMNKNGSAEDIPVIPAIPNGSTFLGWKGGTTGTIYVPGTQIDVTKFSENNSLNLTAVFAAPKAEVKPQPKVETIKTSDNIEINNVFVSTATVDASAVSKEEVLAAAVSGKATVTIDTKGDANSTSSAAKVTIDAGVLATLTKTEKTTTTLGNDGTTAQTQTISTAVQLDTQAGSIKLDAAAVGKLANANAAVDVSIINTTTSVKAKADDVQDEKLKTALDAVTDAYSVDVTAGSSKPLSEGNVGSSRIELSFDVPAGATNLVLAWVEFDLNGTIKAMQKVAGSGIVNGKLVGKVPHLSTYVAIDGDAASKLTDMEGSGDAPEPEDPTDPSKPGGSTGKPDKDGTITVTFSLLGDEKHGSSGGTHTLKDNNLTTWIPATKYTVQDGALVREVLEKALTENNMTWSNPSGNYVESITRDGVTLAEFSNGKDSGWMYTLNGNHPSLGVNEQTLSDGDVIVWHYTDNYTREKGAESWGGGSTEKPKDEEEDAEAPVVTMKPEITVDSKGEAKAELKTEDVNTAIGDAKSEGAAAIVIAPEVKGDATRIVTELPKEAVSNVADKSDLNLTVKTDIANITISNAAVKELADSSKTSLTVSVEIVKDESGKATGAVKLEVAVDGKAVTSVKGGLAVSLPAANEAPGSVLVLVAEDGNETIIKKSALDGKEVLALLDGSCTVKIVDNAKTFSDAGSHWAKDAIAFASSHELFQGTDNGAFTPNGTMNRAMLATVLHRLEDEAKTDKTSSFDDVAEGTWYSDSVGWANANGIVTGTGNGFAPERAVTRQELATMLFRYADAIGMDTAARGDTAQFNDAGEISNYAKDAMAWSVKTGLLGGKGSGRLDPSGTATRAEVATILQRLIKMMVK